MMGSCFGEALASGKSVNKFIVKN